MAALDEVSMLVELPIVIRAAERRDVPLMEWYGQYTHFRNLFHKTWREQLQGRRLMLVADCSGFPIGHVFIQLRSTNTRIADGRRRAYLYSFRVMEMFQGRGIGTRLLQEAERILQGRDYLWATIAVAKDNDGALRLYERLGYRKFAEDPGRWTYTDHEGNVIKVEEPCWILEKRLEMG
ncbi:MAG: GNAT family N-acetyltransferase [Anaerolineae bacterium]